MCCFDVCNRQTDGEKGIRETHHQHNNRDQSQLIVHPINAINRIQKQHRIQLLLLLLFDYDFGYDVPPTRLLLADDVMTDALNAQS